LGISGIVPIIYKGGKEETKSAGQFSKEDGAERLNATGGMGLNDLGCCEFFFFSFFLGTKREPVI